MFKNMKVGTKIVAGFIATLILTVVIGGVSVYQMNAISKVVNQIVSQEIPETSAVVATERAVWETHVLSYEFDNKIDEKSRGEWFAARDKALKAVEAIVPISTALNHQDTLKDANEFRQNLTKYGEVGKQYTGLAMSNKAIEAQLTSTGDATAKAIDGAIKALNERLSKAIAERNFEDATAVNRLLQDANDAIDLYNAARQHQLGYLLHQDRNVVEVARKALADLIAVTKRVAGEARTEATKKLWWEIGDQVERFRQQCETWIAQKDKQVELLKQSDALAVAIVGRASKSAIQADKDTYEIGKQAMDLAANVRLILTALALTALVLGSLLAFFITRGITKPLRLVITGISQGAAQVASASNLVATSSQSLAEGASQQAAAIEETSSSLEEMSSMTKTNADNASQANQLMADTKQVVGRANTSMGELTGAMQNIQQASQDTGKIIKTIDEIAFQTNLLALNAAVEAARAGEAGAGFAVVADEVRNLAQRAAEAAKNTQNLIEETLNRVKQGAELASRTNADFNEVATSAAKVAELVGEITAASAEQAQGIEQVNKAVNEMDKVIQSNAANAEESASASEELSAQAQTMEGFVADLARLVGANGQETDARWLALSGRKPSTKPKALPSPQSVATHYQTATRSQRRPQDAIPMEDDFRDF